MDVGSFKLRKWDSAEHSGEGNPSFATRLKVTRVLGLRLYKVGRV
jgi:DNA-binding phage protein